MLKLKPPDGRVAACLISASSLTILSSLASRISGTLHPKVFAPARALSIRWSSSSLRNGFRRIAGISSCSSASSRSLAARVLMSAADSDPIEIFSAPFFGSLMAVSISLYIFWVTSRRVGVPAEPVKRFLNLTDLGVPRYCGSLGRERSSGAAVACRFLALPASNSTSPVTVGRSVRGVEEGELGVVGSLTDDLLGLEVPRILDGGLWAVS